MQMDAQQIESIVRRVIEQLHAPQRDGESYGVFKTLDDAVAAAQAAHKKLRSMAQREAIIKAIRRSGGEHIRELSELAVQETGFGRVDDKIRKHQLVLDKTPGIEAVVPMAVTGDHGLSLVENAPWGAIASVTPSTNPSATILNNAISMIAGGNSVVFSPHPAAKAVSQRTIQLINRASVSAGGPANLVTCVEDPTIEAATRLFSFPGINLLTITGGEAVVNAARKVTDKRLIAAGPGNPPVVVDETADIERAAISIVQGASFDNNIVCVDEKEIVAVESIATKLKESMCRHGAAEISADQADAVARLVLAGYPGPNPRPKPEWVGRDAEKIAAAAGFSVPAGTRLLVTETARDHAFATTEMMLPVISLIRVKDADQAIDWAVELEAGNRHTAAMHSRNIDNLSRMALEINCSLFVKNGPCLAGLGAGGEGWTSMTISTPTGEGVTNASTFVRKRRCTLVDSFRIV
ncbi:aldehyde dehydrogenase [Streptosporangium jomthongense]|uniref:Aldehyde dehydrogenase family protein n=1 Tax=Marinobacter aromaticivorans TaxID=1494078 RepID=A0ABW2ITJ6_9GAMM|nr:aldehyde dehydrogenase family protein [Marinobacter aromaticivorans]GGE61134.1 aldehyde dehydrogenase [Streptosporangium jomthongense]